MSHFGEIKGSEPLGQSPGVFSKENEAGFMCSAVVICTECNALTVGKHTPGVSPHCAVMMRDVVLCLKELKISLGRQQHHTC